MEDALVDHIVHLSLQVMLLNSVRCVDHSSTRSSRSNTTSGNNYSKHLGTRSFYCDHEISILVHIDSYRLNSLLIMEIMAIHSWKSQYISVWFLVMIYCVIC
jgi:hypothetical protein